MWKNWGTITPNAIGREQPGNGPPSHLDPEFRPFGVVSDRQPAAHVGFDDDFRHEEPHSRPLVRPLGGEVRLEDPAEDLLRYPPGIAVPPPSPSARRWPFSIPGSAPSAPPGNPPVPRWRSAVLHWYNVSRRSCRSRGSPVVMARHCSWLWLGLSSIILFRRGELRGRPGARPRPGTAGLPPGACGNRRAS
jgi:hypothetical protein